MKFYKCEHCGNIVNFLVDSGVPVVCCGEKMKELIPNTVEASVEKHIPVVVAEGNKITVKVGSVEHPMIKEHYISFVLAETDQGFIKKDLVIGSKPECSFLLNQGEKLLAAYAYCNLHGLWKGN